MEANLTPTVLIGSNVIQLDLGEVVIVERFKDGRGKASYGQIEELQRVLKDADLSAAASKPILDRVIQVVDRVEYVIRHTASREDIPTDVRLELVNASFLLRDLAEHSVSVATDTDRFDKASHYFSPEGDDRLIGQLNRLQTLRTGGKA